MSQFTKCLSLICAAVLFFVSTAAQEKPQSTVKTQNISASSPSGVVTAFYRYVLERKFRDALMLTNWRGAVEALSPEEMKEFDADLEPLADNANGVVTTGEQISGTAATVFVKGKDPQTGEEKLDQVNLRQENNVWIILLGDAATEAAIRRDGKNYLLKLHLDARHNEVEMTLKDIISAQLGYSLQNAGEYADLQTLAAARLVPVDILKPEVIGYRYRLTLSADRKKYTVNAEPFIYGKTGKLSFILTSGDAKNAPKIENADKGGASLQPKN
jgi:hypothetical protein